MKPTARIFRILDAHRRTIASFLAVALAANAFVLAQEALTDRDASVLASGQDVGVSRNEAPDPGLASLPSGSPASSASKRAAAKRDVRALRPGSFIAGKGTVPNGISGNELTVVYYWKGDQTKSSPFLNGTGQEGNVDEGQAFRNLVAYINKHADGGQLMGQRFDLHGWELKPVVVEAGKGDDQIRAAELIASEIKPFAAVSSHGSISAYVCPRLAKAKIFNVSTYDLDWGLFERTGGFCLPQGLSWEAQVDLSIAYLKKQAASDKHATTTGLEPRRYGLLYAEYPGLVQSAPRVQRMLAAEGLDVTIASVDPDLTTAGRQQPGVIAKFRAAGVNTIVAPESGSLITFTHAAQANGFTPDYFVWPCSGQDSLGMVRLYNASQWARASGLTCYDAQLNADLSNDDTARKTQWYRAYREMAPGAEPPAQTSLVYQSLLPLVAGITHAGRDLTIERFREGLRAVAPYRYDAIEGRTTDPTNILVTLDAPDGSQVGDAGTVRWDPSKRTQGNAAPGTYVFTERRRYKRGASF
ncbi:MAG TPA: ABC transporter substrate-binding protein [Actinomycetota bacterium]|nr:ABC transporter substrate-binding protein [Actinomycetota bacterium]